MNFESLYRFLTVAQQGSISAAARKLMLAQPALSKQMRQLEEELGCTLFIRGSRTVQLTDAGRALCERAESLREFEDSVRLQMGDYAQGGSGVLRIGISPLNSAVMLETLMTRFLQLYPKVRLDVHEAPTNDIFYLLREGIVEVGIVKTNYLKNNAFTLHYRKSEPLVAVWHRDFPFDASKDIISLKDIAGVPISITRAFKELFSGFCTQAGFMPDIVCCSSQATTNLLWVRLKKAVGIVPRSIVCDDTDLRWAAFEEPHMDSPASLITVSGSETSVLARNLIAVFKEVAKTTSV